MKKNTFAILTLSVSLIAGGMVTGFVLFDPPGKWLSGDVPRNIDINQNGHGNVADSDGGVTDIRNAIAASVIA